MFTVIVGATYKSVLMKILEYNKVGRRRTLTGFDTYTVLCRRIYFSSRELEDRENLGPSS